MLLLLIFSLFVSFSLSVSLPLSPRDSSPLSSFGDQVRQMHLYTDSKHRSFFLEIFPNGTITGSSTQTEYTVLELKAVNPGQTAIQGVMSSLYLCLDASGHLVGKGVFSVADCSFTELLRPDGYTHFLSAHHTLPVSLTLKHTFPFSQFLPLRNSLLMETSVDGVERPGQEEPDLDTDDPFRLRQNIQNPWSPVFHTER